VRFPGRNTTCCVETEEKKACGGKSKKEQNL